jgi:sugar O-acyltransferase (sialic acid O-acetyltransferase NeuD family)
MAPLGRVVAPLLSPNEPEAQVVEVGVDGYSKVRCGEVVCVVETSKATAELESEWDGYTGPVTVQVGDRVEAGQVICEVFERLPEPREHATGQASDVDPAEVRLSRSAEKLALEAGIDLSLLPTGRFVTEADVRALIDPGEEWARVADVVLAAGGERSLVVFGAGGHAKSLIDLVRSSTDYELLCVADDRPDAVAEVLGVPVVAAAALEALREQGVAYAVNAVGGIGRIQRRIDVGRRLDELGFELPPLVDATAFVAASASVGSGAQVFARAAVCSDAAVGRSAIVNTGAIVSHDCRIGDHAHVAPGALLAGSVEVGEGTLVGMGATVNLGVAIGARSIVGNGAVVNESVPANTTVPAGTVWPQGRAARTAARHGVGQGARA